MTWRVLVVDDQALVRGGVSQILGRAADIVVVDEATDGRQAVDLARRYQPDVVLMDLRMPRLDGVAATREITEDAATAAVRVLVLTTFDDDELVVAAIRAGASGFLLKDAEPDEIRAAVRTVAAGDALLAPSVTRAVLRQVAAPALEAPTPDRGRLRDLTAREIEVLTEVGRGRANDEIAAILHLSSATVRTYVSRILAKTGARDRAQLVVLAYVTRLVVVDT